jgi:hypothetical protein
MNDVLEGRDAVRSNSLEETPGSDLFPVPPKSHKFGPNRVLVDSPRLNPAIIAKKRAEIRKNIGWHGDSCLFYFSMADGAFGTCLLRHPEERIEIAGGDDIVIPENAVYYSIHFPTDEFTPAMMVPGVKTRTKRPFKTIVDLASKSVDLITLIKQKVVPEPYAIVTSDTNDTMARIAEKLGFKRRVRDGHETNSFVILYEDIEGGLERLKKISKRKKRH